MEYRKKREMASQMREYRDFFGHILNSGGRKKCFINLRKYTTIKVVLSEDGSRPARRAGAAEYREEIGGQCYGCKSVSGTGSGLYDRDTP